jgi:hypothetical protein
LNVSLFRSQWIRLSNGVKTDKYGMTNVNFKFLGYRDQLFVLAKDVKQVYKVVSRNAPTLDSLIISILLTRLRLQAETTH